MYYFWIDMQKVWNSQNTIKNQFHGTWEMPYCLGADSPIYHEDILAPFEPRVYQIIRWDTKRWSVLQRNDIR